MATTPVRTSSDADAQREMEQAEFFLTTIMDARAAQDAFDLDDASSLADAVSADASPAADDGSKHVWQDDDAVGAFPLQGKNAIVSESPLDVSCFDDSARGDDETPVADATAEAETAAAASPAPLAPLELALLESDDRPVQWNLISPWSESDEANDSDDDDENGNERLDSDTRAFFRNDSSSSALYTINEPEPEEEFERNHDDQDDTDDEDVSTQQIEAQLRALIKSESTDSSTIRHVDVDADGVRTWTLHAGDADDDDDEEFEVFNAAHTLVLNAAATGKDDDELVDEKLVSSASEHDQDDEYGTDGTRTSVATTLDDSCEESPRPSGTSRFLGRRAQTYSGVASASMQTAFAKLRSRTLSTTSSFRHAASSSQSSSRASTSDVEESSASGVGEFDSSAFDLDASGRGSSRGSSMSSRPTLTSRLGSVSSLRMSGSKMTGFLRFRSSSATTAASDESDCLDVTDTLSAPSLSSIDTASALHPHQQPSVSHQSHQMHALKLKASAAASKAAGYLNAASVEAARKLKSRAARSSAAKTSCDHESSSECERVSGA